MLVRATLGLLACAAVSLTALSLTLSEWVPHVALLIPGVALMPTAGPTPPAPALTAPRGDAPGGHVAFQEWAAYRGEAARPVGCGFLLEVNESVIVGVTTAHSVGGLWGGSAGRLQSIAFHLPGQPAPLAVFDTLHGLPGEPFTGYHFTADYLLLQADQAIDPAYVLRADERGRPEPGERTWLYSGLGDGQGRPRRLAGTITAVADDHFWMQLDEAVDPGGMSGSPLISQHTGRVVGMAVSGTRSAPVLIGAHPVGSLIRLAAAAEVFPAMAEFGR